MDHIEVIAGGSYKPISLAIQLRTWWLYSHVGVIMPDGKIIEAVGGQGVVITERKDFESRYTRIKTGYIYCLNKKEAYDILYSRVGRKYDNRAFWGIAFGLGWDDIEADQCAELVAIATQLFPQKYVATETPKTIMRLMHDNIERVSSR